MAPPGQPRQSGAAAAAPSPAPCLRRSRALPAVAGRPLPLQVQRQRPASLQQQALKGVLDVVGRRKGLGKHSATQYCSICKTWRGVGEKWHSCSSCPAHASTHLAQEGAAVAHIRCGQVAIPTQHAIHARLLLVPVVHCLCVPLCLLCPLPQLIGCVVHLHNSPK